MRLSPMRSFMLMADPAVKITCQPGKEKIKYICLSNQYAVMKKQFHLLLAILLSVMIASCNKGKEPSQQSADENTPHVVKKKRDDGTLSSLNPVDSAGYLDGVKVNFYEDGLTVHSKVTYEHGSKQGPAIWFFKSGKVYEYTTYEDNKKEGVTRRYYETGELYEEVPFEAGEELPGRKRYDKEGNLISP